MEKTRSINTKFWKDSYVLGLGPQEKLVFIYLLTNSSTRLCGIYELPLPILQLETGLDVDTLRSVQYKFQDDGKIYFFEDWVLIKNFLKHQKLNTNMKIAVRKELCEVPDKIWLKIKEIQILTEWYETLRERWLEVEEEVEVEKEVEVENVSKWFDSKKQEVKALFWGNPLFGIIQKNYPYRDFDYQFELMWDWWRANKRKIPRYISAFENWLKNTRPDPNLIAKKEAEMAKKKEKKYDEPTTEERANLHKKYLKARKELLQKFSLSERQFRSL